MLEFHSVSQTQHFGTPVFLATGRIAISSSRRLLSESEIQRSSCKPLPPRQKLSSSDRKRIDALRPGELVGKEMVHADLLSPGMSPAS